MAESELLSSKEAAALLGYTVQHVRRLVRENRLQGRKVGRDWVITRESVRRFIADRENTDIQFPRD